MHHSLMDQLHELAPEFNQDIVQGYAKPQLDQSKEYLDSILYCAQSGFPEGLEFKGSSYVRPQEEYDILTGGKNSTDRVFWDTTRVDVVMVKYHFTYLDPNGRDKTPKDLKPFFLFLPFVDECGMITIAGKKYHVKPVLVDPLLSVTGDEIFVPFNSTNITFYRTPYPIMIGSVKSKVYITHGIIHHQFKQLMNKQSKSKRWRITSNAHYLFCKYGVAETFSKYAKAEVIFGTEDTINTSTHPESEYTIYQSAATGTGRHKRNEFTHHGVRIAVPNTDVNSDVDALAAAFFYVLDHFPDEIQDVGYQHYGWWMVRLGKIMFEEKLAEGSYYTKVMDHIASVDRYVDEMVVEQLQNERIWARDMYDFLFYLIQNFTRLIIERSDSVNSMYGKRLTVNRYVLSSFVENIFRMVFQLSVNKGKAPTESQILGALARAFSTRRRTNLNASPQFVSVTQSSSDCRYFKITSEVVPQDHARPKGAKANRQQLRDDSLKLHVSLADVGCFAGMNKSEPIGRNRLNPCATLLPNGTVVEDPTLNELREKTQRMISQRRNSIQD